MASGRDRVAGRSWRFAVPLAGVFLFVAATRDVSRWKGDWWWGYQHLGQALPIVLPMVAMVVAWDAGTRDGGLGYWRSRLPDAGWKVPASIGGKTIAGVLTLQVLAVGAVVTITVLNDGAVAAGAWMVVGAHLVLTVWSGMLGLVFGALLPSAYATIASGATVTAAAFFSAPFGHRLLDVPGASSSLVGGAPSTRYFVALGLVTSVGVVALWWTARWSGQATWSYRPDIARTVSVAALVMPILVVSWGIGPQQFRAGVPPTRCVERDVRVCVFPGYDALAPSIATDLVRVREAASAQGIRTELLPRRFEQDHGRKLPRGTGVIAFDPSSATGGPVNPLVIADAVSAPVWCAAMFAPEPPEVLLEDRQLVYDWALVALGVQSAADFTSRHPNLSGSADARAAQVNSALQRMNECS